MSTWAAPVPQLSDSEERQKTLSHRIPLVIGVTGHDKLRAADEPSLREEVRQALCRLRRDYLDDSPHTPLVILSSLDGDAECLVAEVAVDHGAILIAALPQQRLASLQAPAQPGASPDKPRDLLRQAAATIELPHDRYPYLGTNLYVATHCHVLIAIWDGEESDEQTSPARIIGYKRHGIPFAHSKDARMALDGSEIGPVIEIKAPKEGGAREVAIRTEPWGFEVTGAPRRGWRRFLRDSKDFVRIFFGRHPHEDRDPARLDVRAWNVFRAISGQTRRFNLEAAARSASPEGREAMRKSLEQLFTDYADAGSDDRRAEIGPVPDPPKDPKPVVFAGAQSTAVDNAERWCAIYQRADALALSWQREFKSDWLKLFTAGFVAIVFFEAYAHVCDLALLLMLYIGTLGYGFFLFIRARTRHHQEHFLDYRALAEALRVAVYWKVACIRHCVAEAYPIKQPSELAWVKIVVRTLDMLDDALGPTLPPADRNALDNARMLWVVGQRSYFKSKSRQLNLHAEKREEWSLAALAASPIVGAIGLGILYFVVHDAHLHEHLRHAMIVVMGLLVGGGAVIAGYTEQLAFKAQARQYDRMHLLFEHALLLINKILNANPATVAPQDVGHVQDLYVELGKEAMKENAEWVAIYRQRPIRPAG